MIWILWATAAGMAVVVDTLLVVFVVVACAVESGLIMTPSWWDRTWP